MNHDKSKMRKTGVAGLSLAVLGSVAITIAGPTSVSFAATQEVSKVPGAADVFYGKVTHDGQPVKNARVVLYRFVGGYEKANIRVVKVVHTGSDGTYRNVVTVPRGRYYEQVSFRRNGRLLKSNPVRLKDVTPGHAYRVDAAARQRGLLSFLPVASY